MTFTLPLFLDGSTMVEGYLALLTGPSLLSYWVESIIFILVEGGIPFLGSFVDVLKNKMVELGSTAMHKQVPLPYTKDVAMISLGKEVNDCIASFSRKGLIYRFCRLWPSLPNLHHWIFQYWTPLMEGKIEIYGPSDRGVFVVCFNCSKDS